MFRLYLQVKQDSFKSEFRNPIFWFTEFSFGHDRPKFTDGRKFIYFRHLSFSLPGSIPSDATTVLTSNVPRPRKAEADWMQAWHKEAGVTVKKAQESASVMAWMSRNGTLSVYFFHSSRLTSVNHGTPSIYSCQIQCWNRLFVLPL